MFIFVLTKYIDDMKPKIYLFVFAILTLLSYSCEKEIAPIAPQEEAVYEITINVSYSKNNVKKPDSFSPIYIYYERDPSQFQKYYYMGEGVFRSKDDKTILPDEYHQADGLGTLVLKEDAENKRNFTVLVESRHKDLIAGNYYEYRDKSRSMDFIFH